MTYVEALDRLLALFCALEIASLVAWWRLPAYRRDAAICAAAVLVSAATLFAARAVIHYLP